MASESAIPARYATLAVRPNLRLFVTTDSVARDIFLQALSLMQTADISSCLTHYQIGGIHGAPYVAYDGDSHPLIDGNNWYGYCHHSDVLFPTWHRPNLMLYERCLIKYANQFVASLPDSFDKDALGTIANNLRIPYLDCAESAIYNNGFPAELTDKTISVKFPEPKTITNPLYGYKVQAPVNGTSSQLLAAGDYTQRYPLAAQQELPFNIMFFAQGKLLYNSLPQDVYKAITVDQLYATFSNQNNKNQNNDVDIESAHNIPHNMIGGPRGAMTSLEIAAFDPLFFCHHACVDRNIACWQFLYDPYAMGNSGATDYWLPPALTGKPEDAVLDGTYANAVGEDTCATTALNPHRNKDTNQFFNSNDVRWVIAAGGTADQQKALLKQKLSALYTPDAVAGVQGLLLALKPSIPSVPSLTTPSTTPHASAASSSASPLGGLVPPVLPLPLTSVGIAIRNFPKMAFGESVIVKIFIQTLNATFGGAAFVLSRADVNCLNCVANNKIKFVIDISKTLVNLGLLTVGDTPVVAAPKLQALGNIIKVKLFRASDNSEILLNAFPNLGPHGADPITIHPFTQFSVFAKLAAEAHAIIGLVTDNLKHVINPPAGGWNWS